MQPPRPFRIFAALLLLACAAHGQTVKMLGYNSNNVIVGVTSTNAIVFSNPITATKFNGTVLAGSFGAGGSLNMNAVDGSAGSINTSDGGGDGNGGSINTSGNIGGGWGGSINTSGGTDNNGGSINLSDGGGSINTQGTGTLELGSIDTRTTLTGTATTNRAISLPDASGTVALLAWTGLTNTNAANFQAALFSTNTAPTNATNAAAWISVQVGTNSYRLPVYQ